jgi:quercetin dioxygenase-like cupin family protein
MRRPAVPALFLTAFLLAAGCGGSSGGARAGKAAPGGGAVPTTTAVPVAKDVLASETDPPAAPGRTLTLIRYTIAPGAQLAAHVHPGVQLASIQSGSLTYTVVSGTATVTRAATPTPEPVTGPNTVTVAPGDAVSEKGDMVHFGANHTDSPVVILATLLTESGRDLAAVVTMPPTSAPG